MKAQRVNGSDPAEVVQPLTLRNVRSATRAALTNELMTRARVEAIEHWIGQWEAMTVWQRLRWILKR